MAVVADAMVLVPTFLAVSMTGFAAAAATARGPTTCRANREGGGRGLLVLVDDGGDADAAVGVEVVVVVVVVDDRGRAIVTVGASKVVRNNWHA